MRFMPYSLEELSANDGLFKQRLHSIIGMRLTSKFVGSLSRIAVKDFIIGYGSYEELVKSVGLSNEDVADNARKLLNR